MLMFSPSYGLQRHDAEVAKLTKCKEPQMAEMLVGIYMVLALEHNIVLPWT